MYSLEHRLPLFMLFFKSASFGQAGYLHKAGNRRTLRLGLPMTYFTASHILDNGVLRNTITRVRFQTKTLPSFFVLLQSCLGCILNTNRKIAFLRPAFSSSCGGLKPLAATVGPFEPNNRALRAT